jgi:hypothetical protein
MMNPMYFISQNWSGCAQQWCIRTGTKLTLLFFCNALAQECIRSLHVICDSSGSHLEPRKKIIVELSSAMLLCAAATSILGLTALSMRQTSGTVPNTGSMKGVGVGIYWDSLCTNKISLISWGILTPGSKKTINIYVRNEGNAVLTLSKTTENWNPSNASSYMSLTWNYANQTINVNQALQVSLTLTVSSNVKGIDNFSFDVMIVATG